MATFKILSGEAPFFVLEVSFSDMTFVQNVMFPQSDADRPAAMQAYADQYEADWVPPEVPADE